MKSNIGPSTKQTNQAMHESRYCRGMGESLVTKARSFPLRVFGNDFDRQKLVRHFGHFPLPCFPGPVMKDVRPLFHKSCRMLAVHS